MALKVTLFDHHFVSLPYIYLFYAIYNYILLFPVSLVIIIIIIIIILLIISGITANLDEYINTNALTCMNVRTGYECPSPKDSLR